MFVKLFKSVWKHHRIKIVYGPYEPHNKAEITLAVNSFQTFVTSSQK